MGLADCKPASTFTMKYTKEEIAESHETLMRLVKPGDTIFTILRHVSQSGMSRDISAIIIDEKGNKYHLDWSISRVLGYPLSKGEGVKVGGCGMDMGFALVNSLSYALFNEYQCTGEKCAAADHVNKRGDNNELPPYKRDGKMRHNDGYALIQKWL